MVAAASHSRAYATAYTILGACTGVGALAADVRPKKGGRGDDSPDRERAHAECFCHARSSSQKDMCEPPTGMPVEQLTCHAVILLDSGERIRLNFFYRHCFAKEFSFSTEPPSAEL